MAAALIVAPRLADLAPSANTLLLSIAPGSQRTYKSDIRKFLGWMLEFDLAPATLTYPDMVAYQALVLSNHATATAARLVAVARGLLEEYSKLTGAPNPARGLRPISVENVSPHVALTRAQAHELLQAIDTSTLLGCRNYAIVKLLIHTGIRRSECSALTIGDLSRQQGHYVATIRHGKGNKRRVVKLKTEVFRAISAYMTACGRADAPPEAPLFVRLHKAAQQMGDIVRGVTGLPISDKLIERLIKSLGAEIHEPRLTPHGLRATFITLAKEGGASLEQRQFAAGHADSRTTQKYDKRKLNLDDNAADYIRIDA